MPYCKVELEGFKYASLTEAATYYGVNISAIYYRLNILKLPLEEAFELKGKRKNRKNKLAKIVKIEDKTYSSIREAAKRYKISYNTVLYRLQQGLSIEEAVGITPIKKKIVKINGVEYPSLKIACQHYNLKLSKIYIRLRHKWSLDEAFEIIPRNK